MDWLAPTLHEIAAIFSPVSVVLACVAAGAIWLFRLERNANTELQRSTTDALTKIADSINGLKMFIVTKGKIQ